MKRYLLGILAAAALLTVSCEKETGRFVSVTPPQDGIVLKLAFGDDTKAESLREGEAARNENLIQNSQVDIFFFRDSTDAAPVRKYKLNASVQDTYVSIPTTFGEVKEIFGGDDYYNSSVETYGKGYTMKNAVKNKAVDIAVGYATVK